MSNFKDRLTQEKAQLDERIEKLNAFKSSSAFVGISPIQQTILNIQVEAMETYRQALLERIKWLEMPVGNSPA